MESSGDGDIDLALYLNRYRGQYAIHCRNSNELCTVLKRLTGCYYHPVNKNEQYVYFNSNMISGNLGKEYISIEFDELPQ